MTSKHLILILFVGLSNPLWSQQYRSLSHIVHFQQEAAEISPDESALLKIFLDKVKDLPQCTYYLQAKSTNLSQRTLVKAAERRAQAVRLFMAQHGIGYNQILMQEVVQSLPEDDTEGSRYRKYQVVVVASFLENETVPSPTPGKPTLVSPANPNSDKPQLAVGETKVMLNEMRKRASVLDSLHNLSPKFVFTSPKKTTEAEAALIRRGAEVRPLYPAWDVETQVFFIQALRDTLLETIRGLYVYIPAQCFVDEKGKVRGTELRVDIKEYVRKSDMAALYLGTPNDSTQFVPFGVYDIRVWADTTALLLNKGQQLLAIFPQILASPDVQLHSGKRNEENLQMQWQQLTQGKGNVRTDLPASWKESWKGSWKAADEKQAAKIVNHLRQGLRLSKEQAKVIAYTLISQQNYEDNKKKYGKEPNKLPPVHPGSAYVFGLNSLQQTWMFGKKIVNQADATLNIEYAVKKNVIFQVVDKQQKLILYPAKHVNETNNWVFRLKKGGEYTVVGVKFLRNNVQLFLNQIRIEQDETALQEVNFSVFDNIKEAKRALRVLDYGG